MKLGWQVLMPLAIANLIITAVLVLVLGGAQ
jgi:NADH:ubiquinone oxidoreductase subunit H